MRGRGAGGSNVLHKGGPPGPGLGCGAQGEGLRARDRASPGPSDVHAFSCHHTQQPGRVPFRHLHCGGQPCDSQLPWAQGGGTVSHGMPVVPLLTPEATGHMHPPTQAAPHPALGSSFVTSDLSTPGTRQPSSILHVTIISGVTDTQQSSTRLTHFALRPERSWGAPHCPGQHNNPFLTEHYIPAKQRQSFLPPLLGMFPTDLCGLPGPEDPVATRSQGPLSTLDSQLRPTLILPRAQSRESLCCMALWMPPWGPALSSDLKRLPW